MTHLRAYLAAAMAVAALFSSLPPRSELWLPEDAVWSMLHLPWAPLAALGVLSVLLVRTLRMPAAPPAGPPLSRRAVLAVTAPACALFLALPDNSRSGDFVRIMHDISNGVLLLKAEPLGPAFFQAAAHAVVGLGLPPIAGLQWVIALVSALAIPAIASVSRTLAGGTGLEGWVLAAVASAGSSALFFGHIETYTVPAVLMLAFVAASLRSLDDGGAAVPCLLFAAACSFHMQMLILAPCLALVCWRVSRRTESLRPWLQAAAFAAVPLALLQLLCLAYPPPYAQSYGGGDGRMLVLGERLLSGVHWTSVFNRLCLYSPAALPALLLAPMAWKGDRLQSAFLLLLAGGWGAFLVLWNPDLGSFKDWDLYAPGGFAFMLAAVLLALRLPPGCRRPALAAMAALNLGRTLPFVADNHLLLP